MTTQPSLRLLAAFVEVNDTGFDEVEIITDSEGDLVASSFLKPQEVVLLRDWCNQWLESRDTRILEGEDDDDDDRGRD